MAWHFCEVCFLFLISFLLIICRKRLRLLSRCNARPYSFGKARKPDLKSPKTGPDVSTVNSGCFVSGILRFLSWNVIIDRSVYIDNCFTNAPWFKVVFSDQFHQKAFLGPLLQAFHTRSRANIGSSGFSVMFYWMGSFQINICLLQLSCTVSYDLLLQNFFILLVRFQGFSTIIILTIILNISILH